MLFMEMSMEFYKHTCGRFEPGEGSCVVSIDMSPTEHLDFMSTMDIDLDISPFEQLLHARIRYQSLTDVYPPPSSTLRIP